MASPDVYLRLSGGLGNQLFQVAFASQLIALGVDVSLSKSKQRSTWGGDRLSRRLLKRHGFRVEQDSMKGVYTIPSEMQRLNQAIAFVSTLQRGGVVHGFFQYPEILLESSTVDRVGQMLIDVFGSVGEVRDEIGVHLRLGDFLRKGTNEAYGCLSEDYYLEQFPEESPVHLFTDDPSAARRLHPRLCGSARLMAGESEFGTLRQMASYSRFLIGNSTFSIWGAWMGWVLRGGQHYASYPKPFFRNGHLLNLSLLGWHPASSTFLDPMELRATPLVRLRTHRTRRLFL